MPDSPLTIPLNTDSTKEIARNFEKYQDTINDNFSTVLGAIEKDSRQKSIDRKQNKNFFDDSKKLMHQIVDSASDKSKQKINENILKECGKVSNKNFPALIDNIQNVTENLGKSTKEKINLKPVDLDFDKRKKERINKNLFQFDNMVRLPFDRNGGKFL